MRRALAGAALLGAARLAAQPSPLVIRDGTRAAVTLAPTRGGFALDGLARALGGRLTTGEARASLVLDGESIELVEGTRFVRVGARVLPLPEPVRRVGEAWIVPPALATDVVPRLLTGYLFDAAAGELRRFETHAAASGARRAAPTAEWPPRAAPAPAADPAPRAGRRRHLVVVDAGHGGPDAGMTGPIGRSPKVREKDITLAVALRLRTALEARGVGVVMTRTTDTLIALADRGRIANQARGDLFVSVHVNAANPRWRDPAAARGFETYFLAEAKTEDEARVAAMENEVVRFETTAAGARGDDPLGFLLRDMAQNEHLRESAELAATVQARLRTIHPGTDRGVKQAGFRVLVGAFMPAVLVEIGFGTNPGDAAWMSDGARQGELAEQLADAVVAYLERYDRKVGASGAGGTP